VRAERRRWSYAALLAALSMAGPFSVDMYLPAFGAIAREFAAPPIAVQQTLSSYLFAYAFMMLWHGALADALGRRPVIFAGIALYALGSLGCAIAGNIESLVLFRTVQGLSAGTGLVVGRAIIRDRFHGPEAQRLMAQVTLMFGLAPALAPVVGGVVVNLLGWRAVFWVMVVFSVVLWFWVSRELPETLPVALRQPLRVHALWRNYRTVMTRVDFLLLAGIPTSNFAAFFIYIAGAPAFLQSLGVTTWGYAWLFVPMIAGVMLGATLSGRIAGRVDPRRQIAIAYAAMAVGVVLAIVITAWIPPSVPWHVVPIGIFTLGSSLMTPSVTLLMLDLYPAMRGLTSSLQGFMQFAFSGVVAGSLAPLLASSPRALAGGMAAFTLLSYAVWCVYLLRNPAPRVEELKS
jgi:MFS transporter, DHA1 family, multidrug resistance protein